MKVERSKFAATMPVEQMLLDRQDKAKSQEQILKDREDETSQLNRLGVAYFHICLLPISATCLTSAFRRRTVISLASQSFSF